MHSGRAQESGGVVLTQADLEEQILKRQLERDKSGELRDRLFGELHGAEQDIETALARKPDAEQVRVLQPLLQAVRLSENLVLEYWESLHGSTVRG